MGETIRDVLVNPTESFSKLDAGGRVGGALLFAVLLGTIGGCIGILLWKGGVSWLEDFLSGLPPEGMAMRSMKPFLYALITPFYVVINLFISSIIVHLLLLISGGANKGFDVTFKVLSYSYGSTALLQIVPSYGGLVSVVWFIICQIIGIRQAHVTTSKRAAVAVLLPIIVCCGGTTSLFWGTKLAILSTLKNFFQ